MAQKIFSHLYLMEDMTSLWKDKLCWIKLAGWNSDLQQNHRKNIFLRCSIRNHQCCNIASSHLQYKSVHLIWSVDWISYKKVSHILTLIKISKKSLLWLIILWFFFKNSIRIWCEIERKEDYWFFAWCSYLGISKISSSKFTCFTRHIQYDLFL